MLRSIQTALSPGISAGDTTLHAFGRNGVTKVDGAYVETQKNITVVEVEPVSIAFTAPTKTDYVEGSTGARSHRYGG